MIVISSFFKLYSNFKSEIVDVIMLFDCLQVLSNIIIIKTGNKLF
jgi:hypothetical protein